MKGWKKLEKDSLKKTEFFNEEKERKTGGEQV